MRFLGRLILALLGVALLLVAVSYLLPREVVLEPLGLRYEQAELQFTR